MFKHIIIDNHALIQGLVAFILSFTIFAYIMVKAWRMRKEDATHLANLPLDTDTETSHTTQS
jgi:hypothetical protein